MRREEALKIILSAKSLDDQFDVAYDILRHSPPISQDKMLLLYAYYKQAVLGDYKDINITNDFSNYTQTFKNNAWSQVKGLSSDDAKKKYIDFTINIIKEEYKV
jgi:acyl-CoA-binding protein